MRGRYKYSQAELEAFELRHGIQLPAAYRRQLLEVGVSRFSRLSPLEEWCQPLSEDDLSDDHLRQDFPHVEPWNDRSLIDPARVWASEYFSAKLIRGSMRIVDAGCSAYLLLVISGSQRGQVWCDCRASGIKGIYPLLYRRRGRPVSIDDYLGPWWTWWQFTVDPH